ncbi:MAG: glycosyltransferase family 4 protein [Thermodesulfobacteriota bacterium]|nr:glycosyltransferase family 4 protein [Thermodesulfobacteriota bacterium]
MRILILTQWFNPEPFFKGLPFAKELVKLGHEVEVLTGFPNYPGGKIYAGYKIKIFQRELIDGIPVLRVSLYPSHDNNALKRVANYTSFALSASLIGFFLAQRPDVIYVYHPPVTASMPALIFHILRKIPFVYDIQDLWPDTLEATIMLDNRIALWLVDKWCQFVYSQTAKIVVLSPGFKETLIKRGVSSDKIGVIYNWCDENHLQTAGRNEALARELGLANRFNIVFAGTMGKAQALDAVLDAADLLYEKYPSIQFIFVGGGIDVERLKKKARDLKLRNVLFLSRRPVTEIGDILNLADVLFVHLKDDPLFKITIPSKTQAYMAVGRPILMAVRGDSAELVKKAGSGITCTPEDSHSIAGAVEKLFKMSREELEQMGSNGKRFYEQELALSIGTTRFDEIFQSVVKLT